MKRSVAVIVGLCMFFVGGMMASAQTPCPQNPPQQSFIPCGHLHQLSKKLELEECSADKQECSSYNHGDCEHLRFRHRLTFKVRNNCFCDETALDECFDQTNGVEGDHCGDFTCTTDGIPRNSEFKVSLATLMKKDGDSFCILAGFHQGRWVLCNNEGDRIASGRLSGVNGVMPSQTRPYHYPNPQGNCLQMHPCYLPDHIVGCIDFSGGRVDDAMVSNFCPETPASGNVNQIQFRACYEGDLTGMFTSSSQPACPEQGSSLNLEGVVYIREVLASPIP